ncbi:Helicase-related_protein [Hexamita inflata]|uniref:Helicase-related protein n=1 Tax=Hexamita inflata TaxID=28002 RepID=A0AA86N963_9EUKA|nr:Helicase-related protein [Hexamita inflata]
MSESSSVIIELSSSSCQDSQNINKKQQSELDTGFQNSSFGSDIDSTNICDDDIENEIEFNVINLSQILDQMLIDIQKTKKKDMLQFKKLYKLTLKLLNDFKAQNRGLDKIKRVSQLVKLIQREENPQKIIQSIQEAKTQVDQIFKQDTMLIGSFDHPSISGISKMEQESKLTGLTDLSSCSVTKIEKSSISLDLDDSANSFQNTQLKNSQKQDSINSEVTEQQFKNTISVKLMEEHINCQEIEQTLKQFNNTTKTYKETSQLILICIQNNHTEVSQCLKEIQSGQYTPSNSRLLKLLRQLQEFEKYFSKYAFYQNNFKQILLNIVQMLQNVEYFVQTLQMQDINSLYQKLLIYNQFIEFDTNVLMLYNQISCKFRNQIIMLLNVISSQIQILPIEKLISSLDFYIKTINSMLSIPIIQQQVYAEQQHMVNIVQKYLYESEKFLQIDYLLYNIAELEQYVQQSLLILRSLSNFSKLVSNDQHILKLKNKANNILQTWKKNEYSVSINLQQNIILEQSMNKLNTILAQTNFLKQFDFYSGHRIYTQIHQQQGQKINQLSSNYYLQLKQQLNQQNFQQVQTYIHLLGRENILTKQILNEVKQTTEYILNQKLSNMANNVKLINIKEFQQQLIEILREVQTIQEVKLIKDMTDKPILDQLLIDRQLNAIVSIIEDSLNFERQISQYLKEFNFSQLNYLSNGYQYIIDVFDQNKLEIFLNCQCKIKEYKHLIQLKINNILQQCITTIKKMSISQIVEKPIIDLVQQIHDVSQYDNHYNLIYQDIIESLKQTLDLQIQNLNTDYSQDINIFEINLQQLPQKIVQLYLNQIQQIKDVRLAQQQMQIRQLASTQDFKSVIANYRNKAYNQEYNILKILQQKIQELTLESFNKYTKYIETNNFTDLFSQLQTTWDDWMHYQDVLKQLKDENICTNKQYKHLYIDNTINNYCNTIVDKVVNSMANTANQIILKKNLRQQSENFTNIIMFQNQIESNLSLGKSFISSSKYQSSLYQKVIEMVFQMLQNNSIQFNSRISEMTNLDEILEFAKNQPINQQLQEYFHAQKNKQLNQNYQNIYSFEEMVSQLVDSIQKLESECKQVFICQKTLSESNAERDEYYKIIFNSYQKIQNARKLQMYLTERKCDISKIEEGCVQHFNNETENIYKSVEDQLKILPGDDRRLYKTFNNYCDNLRAIGQLFKQTSTAQIAKHNFDKIKYQFQTKPEELKLLNIQNVFCTRLIQYKQMSIDIHIFRETINSGIDNVLDQIYQSDKGPLKICEIGAILNSHTNAQIAQQIIGDHQKFKNYSIELRNTGSLRFTLENVLDEKIDEKAQLYLGIQRAKGLSIQEQDNSGNIIDQQVKREEIKMFYQEFDSKYWAQVDPFLYKVQDGLDAAKQNVQKLSQKQVFQVQTKIDILSSVLAYWTLFNTKDYIGTNNKAESRKKLLQPHPAQIVAIFSLLGIDSSNQLKNQLIQVLTGEGKSVILAITAIVLTIMGFDVNCACYSEYLSQRDYKSFTDLFKAFNVNNYITYGTFNEMCENYINQDGNLRTLTEKCITHNSINKSNINMKREKILMIDEVDVFFNEDFYGSSYNPITTIQNKEIIELFDYIWVNRNQSQLLDNNQIQNTQQYKNVVNSLKGWEDLVREAVVDILSDIVHFKTHKYIVHNGLIGYKCQDNISTSTYYGYRTLFAYYQEVENQKIKTTELQIRKTINFSCGNFSYAEIPKNYKHIIGVTGTLDTISQPEMKLLTDEYNIKKFSYLPSVYGTNQLEFAQDSSKFVQIVDDKEYYKSISNEINAKKQGNRGIPVLVLFETSADIEQFQQSKEYKHVDNYQQIKLLTETVQSFEKEGIVRQAVTKGTVTLITREFGRGTDFVCYDQTIDSHGGVHVIQTFFSDELSEEKQIKGRTARQGNRGSYSMIILDTTLEKYGLKLQDIENMKNTDRYYSAIHPKRLDYFNGKYPERTRNIKSIKAKHETSNRFLDAIIAGNMKAVKEFLVNGNKGYGATTAKSKTLILMDVTGSMDGVLEILKNTIQTVFGNIHAVLKQHGVTDSFDVMFTGYRSYNSGAEQLLEVSDWEADPDNLHQFISNVKTGASSAHGEEAVEVGLQHANNEYQNGLTQVILIGDAAPSTRQQIQNDRNILGENYWKNSQFKSITFYEDEIIKLKQRGVKVHTLFIAGAENSFRQISAQTNGTCQRLNSNPSELTKRIAEIIIQNLGEKNGTNLIQMYRDKFGV